MDLSIVGFGMSRLVSGSMNLEQGIAALANPKWYFETVGNYAGIPANFGWDYLYTGNNAAYLANGWVMGWHCFLGVYQTIVGLYYVLSIPWSVIHLWDVLGLRDFSATVEVW